MKINLLLVITFLSFIAYANIEYMHGIVGMTLRDGGIGCICHDFSQSDSINVWIEGPDSIIMSQTAQYKLLMTGGPAVAGGFNIASYVGTLDSADTLTQVLYGELTHTSPNQFINDTLFWHFLYTAPDSLLTDTLYSVANSVNWDSIPSNFDQWNFGENFVIHIIDNPVNLIEEISIPEIFVLYQNYPNPFNPSTKIKYTIPAVETHRDAPLLVTLKVYDVLGNEIAVLVNEEHSPGEYEVEFNIHSGESRNLTSGVYLYQLNLKGPESSSPQGQAGQDLTETKKMLLLK